MVRVLYLFALLFSMPTFANQVSKELTDFNKVEVFGKLNVRLEKAAFDSISIQSGNFDVDEVKFEVSDKILRVKLLSEFPPSIKVNVTVFYKDTLTELSVGGGAKLYNKGAVESSQLYVKAGSGSELDLLVTVDSINAVVNKGAFTRLTGSSRILILKTSTGGAFRSTNLDNEITYATLNGGTAEIKSAEYLNVKAFMGATLKYVNKPKKIVSKERLGGKVDKLEDF